MDRLGTCGLDIERPEIVYQVMLHRSQKRITRFRKEIETKEKKGWGLLKDKRNSIYSVNYLKIKNTI